MVVGGPGDHAAVALYAGSVADYEYRALQLPSGAGREQTRELLGIHAEYGDWELDQHQVWPDGRRKVTVRRRVRRDPQPPMPT